MLVSDRGCNARMLGRNPVFNPGWLYFAFIAILVAVWFWAGVGLGEAICQRTTINRGERMAIRLHFWGADQTVTGSSHHLECAGQNILLDCGLFQGRRQDAADINSHLALSPEQLAGKAAPGLNAVVLSHAHIDHSGDLPLLAKQGYRGPIYTTPSTIDLCGPMLKDAAHIQESDAEFHQSAYAAQAVRSRVPPGSAPVAAAI